MYLLLIIVLYWIFFEELKVQISLVFLIEDLFMSIEYILSEDLNIWLWKNFIFFLEMILEVVFIFFGQRENVLWVVIRKFRFIVFNFGQIIGVVKCNRYFYI